MGEAKKTIVVMDDSEIVLETLRAVLEQQGLTVSTAINLAELETHLAASPPDLVVLDVQMPEVFGHDVGLVLKQVRKLRVPILLFSGLDDAVLAEHVQEAELDGYVSKNGGVGALLERVTTLLMLQPKVA
jgi:two-component system response regulator PrrA